MAKDQERLDALSVGALRALSIDEINKANSGHPGMALDAAPILYALYRDHLVSDPAHPNWIRRDRFVLSAGHASALLYAMLHLTGFGLGMDDLKQFRQLGSRTPGHPEVGVTPGVDASAGPLGQGIGQAVGMAMAERSLSSRFPDGEKLFGHYTYCLCGDGCLEEGISQEAISLAGHLRLNKLILFYDQNGSTLDGPTSNSLSEDVRIRFLASEWNVIVVKDGNNGKAISKAIAKAKKSILYPTMILVKTTIGYGSEKAGTNKVHGAPLGEEDGRHAKAVYGYEYPEFTVPDEVYKNFKDTFGFRGEQAYATYQNIVADYAKEHPSDYAIYQDALAGNVEKYLPEAPSFLEESKDSTRNVSGRYVASLQAKCPLILGGSADVAGSVKTAVPGDPGFSFEHPEAKNVNWGIREFAMAAANNGILLHGGLRTYEGSFFVFADYFKPAIRMACLEKVPAIFLLSHDSVAVGEDGPTHQPIEQLPMLRCIPGLVTIRPADAKETFGAWGAALKSKDHPTAILLSRQALPLLEGTSIAGVSQGAYCVYPSEKKPDLQILATGSEVSLAIEAAKILAESKIRAEVVSFPSWELFEKQGEDYKNGVLRLPYEKRVSLEMCSTFGWAKYAKYSIGIDTFGASGKGPEVAAYFGFTPEKVAAKILSMLAK